MEMPRAKFFAKVATSTFNELLEMRKTLQPLYDKSRTMPITERWSAVDEAIQRKSGPSGGE